MIGQHRLETLGSQAGMVAHEFRNLLTPAVALAQHALGRGDADGLKRALDLALRQMLKAGAICEHLLGLVRPDANAAPECDVAEALEDVIACAVRPLERDGIEVEVRAASGLRVRGESSLFQQVILNLVLNARRAVGAVTSRKGRIVIRATREDALARIDVIDNGVGMTAERLEQVINPFLAADATQDPCDWQSIGLGLNVCRTIAQRHGASLGASQNDTGCTFVLRWPLANAG
jgi:signal transduction histidine kinase